MKIRSITAFLPTSPSLEESLATAGEFLAHARRAYEAAGYEVQTVRAAGAPLARLLDREQPVEDWAAGLEQQAVAAGVDYLSVGPIRPGDGLQADRLLPALLDATERVFATVSLTDGHRVDLGMARAAARCIVALAPIRENGFGNLRFAALARVPAGVPFLPAAYHDGGAPCFALALESADLAREAFAATATLDESSRRLTSAVEEQATALQAVADRLELEQSHRFAGCDFSLAPFPRDEDSIGATLESMGLRAAGGPATTLAASLLTSALDRASFRKAGFNGLFLPVLEDDRLARRASEGSLALEDLLLASAVCGTGLDTVPLPGDVRAEELVPSLLDLAALALRLDKPLTARLMPMPGRGAGDELRFDFPFFAAGRVMPLRRRPLEGRLAGEAAVELLPRHMRKMP